MARNSGKRPHELALEVLKPGVTITPTELEKHVGNGPYASKHIWFLRKLGHDITVNKDGRTVVSYTYNGVGSAQPVAVAAKPAKVKPEKPAKAAKPKKAKAAKVEDDEDDVPVMDRAAKARAKPVDEVEEVFGTSGAVASHSVDPDWDSVEGIDVKSLI